VRARCRLRRRSAARWPDGIICGPCHKAAQRRVGACSACGRRRVLPGQHGQALLCAPCSGIPGYVCVTCNADDEVLWGIGECLRSALRRRLGTLLDDGTGQPAAFLAPLVEALCAAKNPASGHEWLRSPAVRDRLRALARGELPLTHEALSTLPPSGGVHHLRELLMAVGLLPTRNADLLKFEQWSAAQLGRVQPGADRQAHATYLAWHHHRRLTRHLADRTLKPSAWGTARQQVSAAVDFLAWLRNRGKALAGCDKHDVDEWFANSPSTRTRDAARRFITFAVQRRICRPLRVPAPQHGQPNALPHHERIALIRRLLADDTLATGDRVAGLLVLLYAQPVARISRLPVDAVTVTGQQVRLQIAAEQLPLPEPLAELTARLVGQRRNMGTAAKPASRWLFPGRLPGQPITAKRLLSRLRALGVTRAARTAAFDQLLRDIPAPVLADLVGCNPRFAAERAAALATDWPPTQHSGPPMPSITHSRRNTSPTRDAAGLGHARSELGSSE
jgi:hypothetical protein